MERCGNRAKVGAFRHRLQEEESPVSTERLVTHLNPDGLHRNPAYSQVATVSGPVKTVYVGGQNAVTATGAIVGEGDLGTQTEQVLRNLEIALAAAGAGLEHVVKWQLFVREG